MAPAGAFKMRTAFAVVAAWLLGMFIGKPAVAEKIRVGVVSPAPGLSAPWIAKETGAFAKHGLDADVILLTGSPRLVQSLIAGDVHYALVGAGAVMRARMRGAEVVILAAASNVSSQKLLVNPKSGIRKLEDLKGRIIGVSQYGSDADGFARTALSKAGLKPEKDVAILQMGGHPQVAAALVAGKLDAGVLGGLALVTAQKSGAVVLTSAVKLETVSLGPVVAVTRQYAQQNRDTVMRFLRASWRRSIISKRTPPELFLFYKRQWAASAPSRLGFSTENISNSSKIFLCRRKKDCKRYWTKRATQKSKILSPEISWI
jgi:ABC-type nitrate/sulfonate/bicarbonate transport system substrate-binding protein